MPGADDPRDAALEQAAVQLSDGLKTCRKLVDGYRAMLSEGAEPVADPAGPSAPLPTRENA